MREQKGLSVSMSEILGGRKCGSEGTLWGHCGGCGPTIVGVNEEI